MKHLKSFNLFLEDATSNASNCAGAGAVVSAQPGSLPGTTGSSGSGDVSFFLTDNKKKRKKGDPAEVSDLRDLEPAKTNKVKQ